MNKKYLIALGIVGIVIVSVILILVFKNPSNGPSGLRNLLPFGSGGSDTNEFNQEGNSNSLIADPESLMENSIAEGVVRKLSETPVTGALLFRRNDQDIVRFLEKATGHIYEVNLSANSRDRVSNTTIPKTEEVLWGKDGLSFILRNANSGYIQTIFGQFDTKATGTPQDVLTEEIDENILMGTFSPDKSRIATGNESPTGFELRIGDANAKRLTTTWKYPLSEWRIAWPESKTIALTGKASANVGGSLFFINPDTGAQRSILTAPGLITQVSPDANNVLYSTSQNNSVLLSLKTLSPESLQALSYKTIADKCAWISSIQFVCAIPNEILPKDMPDSWYRGDAQFTDTLWIHNIRTGESREIVEFSGSEKDGIDVDQIISAPNQNILLVKNKKDGILWAVTLQQQTSSVAPSATTTPGQ